MTFGLLSLLPGGIEKIYWDDYPEFVSPLPTDPVIQIIKEVPQENMDTWVNEYAHKYFPESRVSEVKMIIHCLLHRESGHGGSNRCGDDGLACGILQFHQATWVRMRQKMLTMGLIEDIGDRYDVEQAINTTLWALSQGYGLEWGPINRYSKGDDYATCQKPSWY